MLLLQNKNEGNKLLKQNFNGINYLIEINIQN